MQQYSGQSTGAQNQTQDYEKYLITGSDVNNLFSSLFATTLSDIEVIIKKSRGTNAPHYSGVAKILKSLYIPDSSSMPLETSHIVKLKKFVANLAPKYDDDAAIYTKFNYSAK
ncbi:MAG: hypothetical protein WKF59_18070 [Chitinophagaceae bacterium]